jgi:hypothetical protein
MGGGRIASECIGSPPLSECGSEDDDLVYDDDDGFDNDSLSSGGGGGGGGGGGVGGREGRYRGMGASPGSVSPCGGGDGSCGGSGARSKKDDEENGISAMLLESFDNFNFSSNTCAAPQQYETPLFPCGCIFTFQILYVHPHIPLWPAHSIMIFFSVLHLDTREQ